MTTAAILVGFITFFMATVQSLRSFKHNRLHFKYLTLNNIILLFFRIRPATCSNPVCDNNPNLCPDRIVCEPIESSTIAQVENAVLYVFFIEYSIRLLTCWTVSVR
jgi:hypothetical protein